MEKLTFVEGDVKILDTALKAEMENPLKHFEKELAALRTGRASSALVENIKVECYGQMLPMTQVATISTPDARLITIQAWDSSVLPAIEKAIQESDLGVSPSNDGSVVRIQLPQMSSSRRDEMSKVLGKKTEDCRIGIRGVRQEYHNQIRQAGKDKVVSEDFIKRLNDTLQKVTDLYIAKADALQEKKEAELRAL